MSETPKVQPLREYTEVVTQLRNLASNIENGAYGEAELAVTVIRYVKNGDACYDVFGGGPLSVDDERALGLLRIGADIISECIRQ